MKTDSKRYKWEVLSKEANIEKIFKQILVNRKLDTPQKQKQFLNPKNPEEITLTDVGVKKAQVDKSLTRIGKAIKNGENIIVFGDYDTDGITATAILWECLNSLNAKALPYLPDRFSEGYGLKPESVEKLSKENKATLIITVDNGIVAFDAAKKAKELGIEVIITDHHQKDGRYPDSFSTIHTTEIGGAGISYLFAKTIFKKFGSKESERSFGDGMELAALGTIADQIPLVSENRSIVKFGLDELNKTKRPGLISLFRDSKITVGSIGTYEVGFVIAPRLNAMGRLGHGLDSLRLLCTKDDLKAGRLAVILGKTNKERQKIVETVVEHARLKISSDGFENVIVLEDETYHEGVIGLAAGKLVEEFFRPSIVFSKGETFSKASARSIPGFNIIDAIRSTGDLIVGGGGHPMAAGFTIETLKIADFKKAINEIAKPLLTPEILIKKLTIDCEIPFSSINYDLYQDLQRLKPHGIGNPSPLFATKGVSILDVRKVGTDGKHLIVTLEHDNKILRGVAFNMGFLYNQITSDTKCDAAYSVEENVWNGNRSLELRLRDIIING